MNWGTKQASGLDEHYTCNICQTLTLIKDITVVLYVRWMPRAMVVIAHAQILRGQLPPTVLLYVLISTSVVRKKVKSFYLFKFFDISTAESELDRLSEQEAPQEKRQPTRKTKGKQDIFSILLYSRDKKRRND